ncbi:hypothetical protein TrLO_g6584 [Triparma laevis f. longispina]|uniref:TAZ-type domain-containing protein n=1 Tax=Triparma laevis f. longispina TaxID=1714387 RepID=A0A9W7FNJ9_9STRA|nr:hypothetical protein TrLO_g6584 [Triparma laevis f. longispina]
MKPAIADDEGGSGVRRSSRVAADLAVSTTTKPRAEPVRISARNERRRMTPFTILYQKYSKLIQTMIKEFNSLEADLRTIPNPNQTQQQIDSAVQRHTKLVLFLKHLKQAGDMLESGPMGGKEDEEGEARDLEKRIKEKFIPVYNRLVKQREDSRKASKAPPPGHIEPRPANLVQAESSALPVSSSSMSAPPLHSTANVASAPADASSIFNKPLKGGSSLTQKLHGSSLGSVDRRHGSGVGSTTPVHSNAPRRILTAGMAPGSEKVLMPPPSIGGGPPTTLKPVPVAYSPAATSNANAMAMMAPNNSRVTQPQPQGSQSPLRPPLPNQTSTQTSTQNSHNPNHVPTPPPPTPEAERGAKIDAPQGAQVAAPSAGYAAAHHPDNLHDHGGGDNDDEVDMDDSDDDMSTSMNDEGEGSSPQDVNSKLNPMGSSPINPHNPAFTFSSPAAAKKNPHKSSGSLEEMNNWVETDILRPHFSQVQQVGEHMISVDNIPPNPLVKKPKKKRKKEPRYAGPSTTTPKAVDYTCFECNEIYPGQATANPWWLVGRQQDQIPRIDINAPNNLMDYHPALVAHELEDGEEGHSHLLPTPNLTTTTDENGGMALLTSTQPEESSSSESEGEEDPGEDFSDANYEGPRMSQKEAARLVVLLNHARNCPGQHKSDKHREVCQSSKFMLLHVRDCTGTTSFEDPCPYPWCRKVKHLLFHLLSCEKPDECEICCGGTHLSRNMVQLKQINETNLSMELKRLKLKREEEEKGERVGGVVGGIDGIQQELVGFAPADGGGVSGKQARANSTNSLAVTPPTTSSSSSLEAGGGESTTNSESTANSNSSNDDGCEGGVGGGGGGENALNYKFENNEGEGGAISMGGEMNQPQGYPQGYAHLQPQQQQQQQQSRPAPPPKKKTPPPTRRSTRRR